MSYYNNTNTPGTRWTYHNDTPTLENQEILTDFNTGQGYSMKKTAAAGAGGRWLGVGGAGLLLQYQQQPLPVPICGVLLEIRFLLFYL